MLKILAVSVLSAASMLAGTITFDEAGFPAGPFASTTFGGVTFSASGGGGSIITSTDPNGTLGLLDTNGPRKELRADIIGGATFVSVDLGDFDVDDDTIFLEIFNASNTSLGFTSQLIPSSFTGMVTLSLSAANIDHAVFGARAPAINGSSVFADNFTFTSAVPEPATFLPVGLAMLGLLVAVTRRRILVNRAQ